MKAGDLVARKNTQIGKESTYLVICPHPARSESYQSDRWQALSCRGYMVVVHSDAMEVISETG